MGSGHGQNAAQGWRRHLVVTRLEFEASNLGLRRSGTSQGLRHRHVSADEPSSGRTNSATSPGSSSGNIPTVARVQRAPPNYHVHRKAGITTGSLHTLWHTHASNLLSNGIPLTAVSARLGHADSTITARVYAHALPDDDPRAADTWDLIVGTVQ